MKEKRVEPGAAFDPKTFYDNNNFAAFMKPIDHNSLVTERDVPLQERTTLNTFYSREHEDNFIPRVKLIRKDYLFENAFIYDNLRIPHHWPVTIRWFQKNHKQPIYTSALEDEKDWKEMSLPNRYAAWYFLFLFRITNRKKRTESVATTISQKYRGK